MTDNTSTIAGDYEGGIKIPCILDEGAPTVTARTYDRMGDYAPGVVWASELYKGDVVALSNDTAATFAACNGLPLVELPVDGETLVIGQIVTEPETVVHPPTTAAANTLAERLAGKYYRVATVEIWGGITKVVKANVMQDGSNAVVVGQSTVLHYNITRGTALHTLCFDVEASGGVGVVAMHYCAAGTNGDTLSCLVGINGILDAATGA